MKNLKSFTTLKPFPIISYIYVGFSEHTISVVIQVIYYLFKSNRNKVHTELF